MTHNSINYLPRWCLTRARHTLTTNSESNSLIHLPVLSVECVRVVGVQTFLRRFAFNVVCVGGVGLIGRFEITFVNGVFSRKMQMNNSFFF